MLLLLLVFGQQPRYQGGERVLGGEAERGPRSVGAELPTCPLRSGSSRADKMRHRRSSDLHRPRSGLFIWVRRGRPAAWQSWCRILSPFTLNV